MITLTPLKPRTFGNEKMRWKEKKDKNPEDEMER